MVMAKSQTHPQRCLSSAVSEEETWGAQSDLGPQIIKMTIMDNLNGGHDTDCTDDLWCS